MDAMLLDWRKIYEEHHLWMKAVLFARLGCRDAVDDAIQQISLSVQQQNISGHEIEQLGPWLYRVTLRTALLMRRKWGREKRLINNYGQTQSPCSVTAPSPLDWLLKSESQQLVKQALQLLPGRDQEILLLKYTEDWSYQEMANHLGTKVEVVSARLHRARLKLRQQVIDIAGSADHIHHD